MSPINQIRRKTHAAFAAILLAVIVAIAIIGGCTTTIIPPSAPQQPVTVYLIDHGRTPSLAMPREDGRFVRYVYGDWNWYALNRTGVLQGAYALLWPSQGGLGRQIIDQPHSVNHMMDMYGYTPESLFAINVEASDVRELNARLDEEFSRDDVTRVYSDAYAVEFIHDPQRYSIFNNSNHRVAHWLRELGCETRGLTMTSQWKVERQAKP